MIEKALFGAGCFWHVEHTFKQLKGVTKVLSGYAGGTTKYPSYEDVCTDTTGHAEVVEVSFNPEKISFKDLLKAFWAMHNPTQGNRQGPDTGSQYRSVIFYTTPKQEALAKDSVVEEQKKYKNPITTEVSPAPTFYEAEAYHQNYMEKNSRMCGI